MIEAGEDDGTLYLAMAYIEGEDLRAVLRRDGALDAGRAVRIAAQVADALDVAHRAGLVHRDVKPGNVLLTDGPDGEHAFVCDFGLARHVSSVSSLTNDRGFVGTIDYVSPEQIEGGDIDGRADVYSLGCLLFECLAGAPPFERESELSVVFAHLNDPPPLLTDHRADLPAAFDAVFATALAKSRADRYSTCGELVRAAEAALEGRVFRRRRHRRIALLALAAAAVAALAAGVFVATHDSGKPATERPTLSLEPNAVNLVDARTRRVVSRIPVGVHVPVADTAWDMAFTRNAAWALLWNAQRLVRIDLGTHRRTAAVSFPWHPGRLAAAGGSIWVAADLGPDIWRVDASTAKVTRRIHLPEGVSEGGVAYGARSLWLASGPGVVRVDPADGRIEHRFRLPGISGSMRLVFANGFLWAARPGNGVVAKIDPADNRILKTTPLHGWVSDLAVGGGRIWVSIIPDDKVYELSPDDLSVQSVAPLGRDPERISFGGGELWSANPGTASITRLDEVSQSRQTLTAGAEPATAAYHDGLVWVGAASPLPPLPPISGQELRIAGSGTTFDPVSGELFNEQALYATCANLLDYPDAAGAAGARLQPEIAAAMPAVSNGGRTYTFRVRQGFRFSPPSNEPVTAATFKHTIERELASPQGDTYASDIVGAAAFRARSASHVAGITARGNRLSITLKKPTGDFLTRLSMPRFCPVPLSVPVHGGEITRPLPSAGPYYLASDDGGRAVLERNPNYHGARPRRSVRIVYDENLGDQEGLVLADQGSVDLLPASITGTPLLEPGGIVDRRTRSSQALARRYHVYQAPIVDYLVFNTRRPLFRDVRLRRAVDESIDRTALAAAFGDHAADRIVPPAVYGYTAGRIYPLRPDVAAARRLAGDHARHAVIYVCADPRERTLADILRRNLAAIRMSLAVTEDDNCSAHGSERADLAIVSGMMSEERDPSAFLDRALGQALYGEPPPPGPWNTPSFIRRLGQAQALTGSARATAYRRLTDELTRIGPLAVFGSWVWSEYFSPNLGCKIFQAHYGVVDLGAICKT